MRLNLGEHTNAGGVYRITCLVNGWVYIGQAKCFRRRATGHASGREGQTNRLLAKLSPEHIEKMRAAGLGRKQSPEAIEKNRAAQLRRHALRRAAQSISTAPQDSA